MTDSSHADLFSEFRRIAFRSAPDPRAEELLARIEEQFESYRTGLRDLLDVAERMRGGDPSLDPEEWYAIRDYCKNLPGLLDSNPASRSKA